MATIESGVDDDVHPLLDIPFTKTTSIRNVC